MQRSYHMKIETSRGQHFYLSRRKLSPKTVKYTGKPRNDVSAVFPWARKIQFHRRNIAIAETTSNSSWEDTRERIQYFSFVALDMRFSMRDYRSMTSLASIFNGKYEERNRKLKSK